jgi:hypothetical protein
MGKVVKDLVDTFLCVSSLFKLSLTRIEHGSGAPKARAGNRRSPLPCFNLANWLGVGGLWPPLKPAPLLPPCKRFPCKLAYRLNPVRVVTLPLPSLALAFRFLA